jgi:predicted glycoside hydrolase/deacetylase ChbG (UPF0249 family)
MRLDNSDSDHARSGSRFMSGAERILVVNADDFGLSAGVNAGIVEAHERGIVTSASLMVRQPAAPEAAEYCRARGSLSAGLHLDLGHWEFESGAWQVVYERVSLSGRKAVEAEAGYQLEAFRGLTGSDPTHLDSHQNVHLREPVASVARALAEEVGVPLRGVSSDVRYCGDFYGQTGEGGPFPEGIRVERLISLIEGLPPGATELACHPGRAVGGESTYRIERERELEALCDPQVREAIRREAISLRPFAAWRERPGSAP